MNLSEVYRKLKKKNVIDYSEAYLRKLLAQGKIPYTEVEGKKDFDYKEVKIALGALQQKIPEKDLKEKLLPDGEKFTMFDKDGKTKTINSTKIFLQEYQGRLAKQKFDVESGKLIYREDVERKSFEVARVLRDQFLALPDRLSGELATTMDEKEVREMLHREINQVLEFLSSESKLYES